jgi:hypothetical protein
VKNSQVKSKVKLETMPYLIVVFNLWEIIKELSTKNGLEKRLLFSSATFGKRKSFHLTGRNVSYEF